MVTVERLGPATTPEEVFSNFHERGVGTVVLKRGARGCEISVNGERLASPGFAVEVVDTTGAGDCFCGGFLAAICRGLDLAGAAEIANATAARSIERPGNSEGVPDYESLLKWIDVSSRRTPERPAS